MNFKSPARVADVIQRMQDSDLKRATNRTRINATFNGDPPYTEDEAREHKIQINTSWGDAPTIMDNARGQWENAFTAKDKYFRVRLRSGPIEKRMEWSQVITSELARIMKRNAAYADCLNSVGAQVMLHGIGPVMWESVDKWCPYPLAIEDLKVPSRTLTSFTNLGYFGVMRRYTPFELYESALGSHDDPGWNKGLVKRILAALNNINSETTDWTNYQFPERIEEDFKSNSGYWGSDAVPTIHVWDFYFRGEDKDSDKWMRRAILDWDQPAIGASNLQAITKDGDGKRKDNGWLYEGKEAYADALKHILHVTFANGAHVAPFRYHSVRGLGYRLYGPARIQNRIRCRFAESVLQEMMWIFSNVPAEDRERLEMVMLNHMGVLPEGVKWVPANERYRPDLNLIMAGMNQNRQLMSEASASYVQDAESGGENDRETATKTMAKLQSANMLIGSFLNKSYSQMQHQYCEIARRFCRQGSLDNDVKEFQKVCISKGIPPELLNIDLWDVEPERTMGNGNRMLASAMVDRIMTMFNRYDPQAQRIALRLFVDANSDMPELGETLVKLEDSEPSDTVLAAYQDLGPLMLGIPAPMRRSESPVEYVEVLLSAMGSMVERIVQSGGMTDEKTVMGLATIGQEISRRTELIAQDPNEKARVQTYKNALGKLMNEVKGFAQRLQEQQQQAGQQGNPEAAAKVQSMLIGAQTQAKIKEATAQQKMRHSEQKFVADQRRKNLQTQVEAQRKLLTTQAEVTAKDLLTEADIRNASRRTDAEMEHMAAMPEPEAPESTE